MIITKTPLRISFVGGGTDISDYYRIDGGAVVSATINKYMYITVNPKFDGSIRVSYSRTEIVPKVEELNHEIVKACMEMVGIKGGIEITSIADIPSGTGLGSSSAFTVGVLNALYTYMGNTLSAEELARRACEIEIDILKHPIGKQDQYAVAYGGLNYFRFHKDETVERARIWLSDVDMRNMTAKLMLFYTGFTHNANEILTEQKEHMSDKIETMNEIKGLAEFMSRRLMESGFDSSFGQALQEGWIRKQRMASAITNEEIDMLYQKATDAGAGGGKLLGAGGGGFILFYVEPEYQDKVREALRGLKEVEFHVTKYGSRVVYFA